MHYNSIFISDVHLGTKDSKADLLNNFLKNNTCENLFLVGDIIDGWKIQKNKFNWKKSHTNVLRRILTLSKNGTQIFYVAGNHDEFLRPFLQFNLDFYNVKFCNEFVYESLDGNNFLVIHGDLFDGITSIHKWLAFLGDSAYDFVLALNSKFNWLRHRFGFGYWSLSKYLKLKVKGAVDFICKFEENLATYCKKRGYDGVICGHIHQAEIKIIHDRKYMNSGDWVESCSALVETIEGNWEILHWNENLSNK